MDSVCNLLVLCFMSNPSIQTLSLFLTPLMGCVISFYFVVHLVDSRKFLVN